MPLLPWQLRKGQDEMSKDNGLIYLRNGKAECRISLWGGNLLSYRPLGEKFDILWLGDLNKFDNIQAVRGGIPVCWPRFAEEKLNDHLPRHGFARLSMWNLQNVCVDENKIEVALSLVPDAQYDLNVSVRLFIRITDKLEYSLETVNHGDEEFEFSEALHAYFNISSVDNIDIKGLAGHQYKNSLDGKIYTLDKDLKISGEFDSVFLDQVNPVRIADHGFNRVITVEKQGSKTTVVWNPAKDLAEMSPGQYKSFVCVEPSNVGAYSVKLPPHEKHTISAIIRVDKGSSF